MLLDDIGGLASEHRQTLVDYRSERTEYVVTTASPEASDFGGRVLSPDDGQVVSDQTNAVARFQRFRVDCFYVSLSSGNGRAIQKRHVSLVPEPSRLSLDWHEGFYEFRTTLDSRSVRLRRRLSRDELLELLVVLCE